MIIAAPLSFVNIGASGRLPENQATQPVTGVQLSDEAVLCW